MFTVVMIQPSVLVSSDVRACLQGRSAFAAWSAKRVELQGRLNVLNQTRVLSGSDYRYVKASGLAKDNAVTRQSKCDVKTALG